MFVVLAKIVLFVVALATWAVAMWANVRAIRRLQIAGYRLWHIESWTPEAYRIAWGDGNFLIFLASLATLGFAMLGLFALN